MNDYHCLAIHTTPHHTTPHLAIRGPSLLPKPPQHRITITITITNVACICTWVDEEDVDVGQSIWCRFGLGACGMHLRMYVCALSPHMCLFIHRADTREEWCP